MSASPLFRLTFMSHAAIEMRGSEPVWRRIAGTRRLTSLLVREVRPGDWLRLAPLDPRDPERLVVGVERLPPRLAGGGGRRET
jgi:hypothetical protein